MTSSLFRYAAGVTRISSVVLFLLAFCADTQAQYSYTITNGSVTINQYTGSAGIVPIPGAIEGLPVTSIGEEAFCCNAGVVSVAIPNSVISIGDAAFISCSNLTNITIGNHVTTIGNRAFLFCTSLASVTIPNSVTHLGDWAFCDCSSLTELIIPNSLIQIGSQAFDGCIQLTYFTIPSSVSNIGMEVFRRCTNLTLITVDAGNTAYSSLDGVLFSKSQTTLLQCPGGKAGSYSIPNGVTNIDRAAFAGCVSLTDILIPNSVSEIGSMAFYGCAQLTNIAIPSRVSNIGREAFRLCSNLASITVDASNMAYCSLDGVLFNRSKTTLVQYPAGKTGSYNIPESVTNLDYAAFANCATLTGAAMPESITRIGDMAFEGCTSLTNIIIPDGINDLARYVFRWATNLTSITIPASVTNIGFEAFSHCGSLASLFFEGNAASLDGSIAFWDTHATVYYVPGTTGWGQTYGNLPTVPWNPLDQSCRADSGVRKSGFGFTLTWTGNNRVVVESCTDLAKPAWTPAGTNILIGGTSYFSDPEWSNYPSRYYRLRSFTSDGQPR
ncbi:MAG TPA: leucine-rich repeat domain-containing protein [Candidatus Paceibacterota bacterium]|nr:leucine-rich repeat domain-containing protein [Candidatus Paceibacterota bacterium]